MYINYKVSLFLFYVYYFSSTGWFKLNTCRYRKDQELNHSWNYDYSWNNLAPSKSAEYIV